MTNTNWQYYAGETTMSNFSQMAGLAVQNFISAAVGIAVAIAFIRALAARSGRSIGNFYSDLVKTLVYVLLPISVVVGLFLVSQGVIQSLTAGPVASQEVIKELGTNGGGFFNVNSAHPFENPTWLSNFVELLLILAIPAALTSVLRADGRQPPPGLGDLRRDAVAVPGRRDRGRDRREQLDARHGRRGRPGFNMEGKEQRFGVASTALWVVVTTAASCGAVNGAMESLTATRRRRADGRDADRRGDLRRRRLRPLRHADVRDPRRLPVRPDGRPHARVPRQEDRGARGQADRVRHDRRADARALHERARDRHRPTARRRSSTPGRNGWSETLYAYTSQANNNGSAFAGYTGFLQPADAAQFGISFANVLGGLAMLGGRFLPLLAVLAIAGSLVDKRVAPAGAGTFRTDSPTFVVVLVGVVLIVALLTFVPALLLGPVVQGLTDQLF